MTQTATLDARDYRQLLFGASGSGLLFQFSRLQEIFEDYSDRILRKPYIDLDTEQSRILMTLALHTELRLAELQQQIGLDHETLLERLENLIDRGLLVFAPAAAGEDTDPPLQLSAKGAATLERMQRLLRKADELIGRALSQARPATVRDSMALVADRSWIGLN